MTGALTLTEFLLARLAENESVARDWQHHPGKVQINGGGSGYLRLVDPARVLADVEAKRAVVEYAALVDRVRGSFGDDGQRWEWHFRGLALQMAMRFLARAYQDHPDFDPFWLTNDE